MLRPRRYGSEETRAGEVLELTRMTKKGIQALCRKNKLYQTPELNDVLYLHYQGYRDIESLEEYTGLKCLWLENNAISEIQGLANQKLLRCLFLNNNLIKKIENLESCRELDTLNLSYNHINRIENCGIDTLPVLTTLILSHNYIRTVDQLEFVRNCKMLSVLDLAHNRIEDILVVKVFGEMPELRVLDLDGNPVVNKIPQYRKTLILECKELTHLDRRPVFPRDRACAEAWKRGGYEEERREHTRWNKAVRRKIRDSVNATLRLRNRGGGDPQVELIASSSDEDNTERSSAPPKENHSNNQPAIETLSTDEDVQYVEYYNPEETMKTSSPSEDKKCQKCGRVECNYQHLNMPELPPVTQEEPDEILANSNILPKEGDAVEDLFAKSTVQEEVADGVGERYSKAPGQAVQESSIIQQPAKEADSNQAILETPTKLMDIPEESATTSPGSSDYNNPHKDELYNKAYETYLDTVDKLLLLESKAEAGKAIPNGNLEKPRAGGILRRSITTSDRKKQVKLIIEDDQVGGEHSKIRTTPIPHRKGRKLYWNRSQANTKRTKKDRGCTPKDMLDLFAEWESNPFQEEYLSFKVACNQPEIREPNVAYLEVTDKPAGDSKSFSEESVSDQELNSIGSETEEATDRCLVHSDNSKELIEASETESNESTDMKGNEKASVTTIQEFINSYDNFLETIEPRIREINLRCYTTCVPKELREDSQIVQDVPESMKMEQFEDSSIAVISDIKAFFKKGNYSSNSSSDCEGDNTEETVIRALEKIIEDNTDEVSINDLTINQSEIDLKPAKSQLSLDPIDGYYTDTGRRNSEIIQRLLNHPLTKKMSAEDLHRELKTTAEELITIKHNQEGRKREHVAEIVETVYSQKEMYDGTLDLVDNKLVITPKRKDENGNENYPSLENEATVGENILRECLQAETVDDKIEYQEQDSLSNISTAGSTSDDYRIQPENVESSELTASESNGSYQRFNDQIDEIAVATVAVPRKTDVAEGTAVIREQSISEVDLSTFDSSDVHHSYNTTEAWEHFDVCISDQVDVIEIHTDEKISPKLTAVDLSSDTICMKSSSPIDSDRNTITINEKLSEATNDHVAERTTAKCGQSVSELDLSTFDSSDVHHSYNTTEAWEHFDVCIADQVDDIEIYTDENISPKLTAVDNLSGTICIQSSSPIDSDRNRISSNEKLSEATNDQYQEMLSSYVMSETRESNEAFAEAQECLSDMKFSDLESISEETRLANYGVSESFSSLNVFYDTTQDSASDSPYWEAENSGQEVKISNNVGDHLEYVKQRHSGGIEHLQDEIDKNLRNHRKIATDLDTVGALGNDYEDGENHPIDSVDVCFSNDHGRHSI